MPRCLSRINPMITAVRGFRSHATRQPDFCAPTAAAHSATLRLWRSAMSASKIRPDSNLLGFSYFPVGFFCIHRTIPAVCEWRSSRDQRKPVDDDVDGTGETANFRASRASRWRPGKRSDQLFQLEITERLAARFGRIAVTTEERGRACSVKTAPSAVRSAAIGGYMRTLGLRCAPSSRSVLVELESNNAGAGDRR